jgi:mRNA-degrading endonuclease toxin of MazEF toxin-antitoxin module
MHVKNFDEWNRVKKEIDSITTDIKPHKREVWWASLGLNIGSEQDGRGDTFERPVLILTRLSNNTFYVAPLSTKCKHIVFHKELQHDNVKGFVLLDQIKVIDKKRLKRKIGKVDAGYFESLVTQFKGLF